MRHHYAMPAIQPVWAKALASFLFACALALLTGCATHCLTTGLNDVYALLQQKQFVDLTHAFEPGIPHWPGFPDERRETLYWYEPGRGKLGSGFFAGEYHRVGQRGTHVDPPAHFVKGLRMVDQSKPYILGQNLYQIELLANLDQAPEAGALVLLARQL